MRFGLTLKRDSKPGSKAKLGPAFGVRIFFFSCCLLFFGSAGPLSAALPEQASTSLISPSISSPSPGVQEDSTLTLWVFFKDKGNSERAALAVSELESHFSPRALARRAKVRSGSLVDWRDLPVSNEYVQTLRNMGFRVRATSKWLNAVSVRCNASNRDLLSRLSFVKQVQRVASHPKREIPFEPMSLPEPMLKTRDGSTSAVTGESEFRAGPGDPSFYGVAWGQLNQIQVPALHQEGFTGEGIFIGVLDTGFNLTHEALTSVNVVAQWDFINWDSITANEAGQDSPDQQSHGTMILGLLGGNKPDVYMGAAYGAEFALAKTEYVPTETEVEEDYWVMGLEWLDSLGVDLVSSSLGYIDWYSYFNMDGHTAVTTLAASVAIANGVSIFNAMGNGGMTSYPYMIAPADGDSVMSIGAVDNLGVIWPLSSRGPTFDGRIKPEVVTQGKSTWCVNPYLPTGYGTASGTSCATPLAAGACALVLQKNPDWNPVMLRQAVLSTATNASSPDTAVGWGILQAQDASDYELISVSDNRTSPTGASSVMIAIRNVPNPFNPVTAIRVELTPLEGGGVTQKGTSQETVGALEGNSGFSAGIYDVSGKLVRNFGKLKFDGNSCTVIWNGTNAQNRPLPSGVYFFTAASDKISKTRKLVLLR